MLVKRVALFSLARLFAPPFANLFLPALNKGLDKTHFKNSLKAPASELRTRFPPRKSRNYAEDEITPLRSSLLRLEKRISPNNTVAYINRAATVGNEGDGVEGRRPDRKLRVKLATES